jgi:hypothetical protein
VNLLHDALQACVPLLPEPFRSAHQRIFQPEHLSKLAGRLLAFAEHGAPDRQLPPYFAAECTPPLAEPWSFFHGAVAAWQSAEGVGTGQVLQGLADAFVAAGCGNVLLLLGQRRTPASLTDARGIPPTRAELLASANAAHAEGGGLTVVARALTKHIPRASGEFWGEVRGSTAQKNAAANQVLERILDDTTWWNVFGHFQHEVVYEARVPSGHGARWAHGGKEFIGFLEPFTEEKRFDGGK